MCDRAGRGSPAAQGVEVSPVRTAWPNMGYWAPSEVRLITYRSLLLPNRAPLFLEVLSRDAD